MMQARKKIGGLLVEAGFLTEQQIETVIPLVRESGRRFGEVCIEEGLINEEQLALVLARQSGLDYVDLTEFDPAEELMDSVSLKHMTMYLFAPYKIEAGTLTIAVSDPTDIMLLDELELLLGMQFHVVVASKKGIERTIKLFEGTGRLVQDVSAGMELQLLKETEEGEEVLSVEKISTEMSPVVKLIDSTILNALGRRASDIHIECTRTGVEIKYRIDGVLYSAAEPLDMQYQSAIISRIKVMSELDISEKRVPQDGRFKLRIKGRPIDFRVSIIPSIFGEDAVIRILDKESIDAEMSTLSLESIGFHRDEIDRFRRMIREPYGMVLVTGPTGSGKTTTLYAALTEINSSEEKIITIEDPVEYNLEGIVQIPVNEKKGLTFAKGLRSVLRHDPDKIMVGEIRDIETAEIAIQSALTGHLLFTTVHANNVFDVLGRFLHMKIEPYNFVSSLNCILAQRLVRKICEKCKKEVSYSEEELKESGLDHKKLQTHKFYEGKGCVECNHTGYKGRSAIVELLDLTDDLREMILEKHSVARLKKAAAEKGTVFLREAAVQKFLEGETTLKEINRVTFVE
ncbi:MAG: Flp pilus assembly complex ATPase component TadA [Proteobacteria bacterium]|nr:Flp pilus assembly complex ATPase component TadA [Pseudomonadota bacterium]